MSIDEAKEILKNSDLNFDIDDSGFGDGYVVSISNVMTVQECKLVVKTIQILIKN